MSTTQPSTHECELGVSAYERVASMLISLLVLIGTSVLIMFLLWLTSRVFASREPVAVQLEEIGTGDTGLTGGMDLDSPMADELGVETDLETPNLEQTLAAVADAVATQAALLDDPALTEEAISGKGGSTGDGRGLGRGSGPGGTGKRRRWEVRFPPGNTIETYGRQLDFFKIEMGVLMPDNKVIYASSFSSRSPTRREGPADQEKRYYLTWQKGGLEQADRELLDKAGVKPGRWILKFIPPELERQLIQLEQNRAGERANRIRTTYFGIRPKGRGYEFYVMDQTYR